MPALPPRQQEKDFDAKLFFQECLPPTLVHKQWREFEAPNCPTIPNVIWKTKLQIYTEPRHWLCILLAAVPSVVNYLVQCRFRKSPPFFSLFVLLSSSRILVLTLSNNQRLEMVQGKELTKSVFCAVPVFPHSNSPTCWYELSRKCLVTNKLSRWLKVFSILLF